MLNNLLISDHIALGAFDFDGNILATDTITYVVDRQTGKEVGIPAHELDQHPELISGESAKYRWHDYFPASVRFFRDFYSDPEHIGPDELKEDVEKALREGKFSPSIYSLIHTFLIPARLFAVITARGHSPDNIVRILWIISESLLTEAEKNIQYEHIQSLYSGLHNSKKLRNRDEALRFYFEEIVSVYTLSNPQTAKYLGITHEKSMTQRKVEAMKHYIQDVTHRIITPMSMGGIPRTIGFSDDGVANMEAMLEYFEGEKKGGSYKHDKIRLYFTGRKSDYRKFTSKNVETEEREDMLVLKI